MAKSQKKRIIPDGATAVASNRRARRDYDILDTLEVGIQLRGSEVKSLRESKVQLAEAFALVYQNELWLIGLHIAPYSHSSGAFGHENDRRRKLLAHRAEIERWSARLDRENLTIVPLSLYFKDGRAKLEIALGRGKAQVDRRHDIAKRDADREAERAMSRRSGKD
ncbi:MAG: SsrA-binding protein SmpB [Acidimicrobiales bacterium]|jgi:SsrA-binding protein|nr:SsrA-binding protein SmpB [Acidimicrobiales bacterium]